MPPSPLISGRTSPVPTTAEPSSQHGTTPVINEPARATQQQNNPALAMQRRRQRPSSLNGGTPVQTGASSLARSASDSALAARHGMVESPPANLSPLQARMAQHVQHAVEEQINGSGESSPTSSISSLALDDPHLPPSAPAATPAQAEAQLNEAVRNADEAIEFMASLVAALQPHAEPPSPSSSSLHVPPLPDSSDSSLRSSVSSESLHVPLQGNGSTSSLHVPPLPDSSDSSLRSSVSSESLHVPLQGNGSTSSLHVPPLPDSSDSSLRRPASSASGTSGRLPPPRTRLTSSQRPSLQIETEDVPEREGDIPLRTRNTTTNEAEASPSSASTESSSSSELGGNAQLVANLKGWASNIGHVAGHEAVAVGLTTAIREVVSGLVRAAQNNAPGTEKAQEAAAGALIALMGLGNLLAMVSRRARGTNSNIADIGNGLQIAGLISSALSAKETGQLRDQLPALARTFVYAGLRDTVNAVKPYKSTPDGEGNPLVAQLANTVPYGFNQFFVNWGQGARGMSGAGFADRLHEISQMSNKTEADEASLQLAKEAPLQLFAYVGANTGGEFFDKIAGSVFEQAVGKLGWSGAAQLQIGHDELHWPTGSEWGDAAEKTISRMSLFGSVIGTSAAAGAAIAADGYSDFHASMANNAVGGALVTALCLPFVMTLMRKARASGSSAGSANNV
ncbi:hypothetical protein [Burkholderia gladioli]|uniref:hypothetical protein n=1 Tax=Burkholderia gladioli TaxID=28095 RepID=UPI000F536EB8|nr:hypothetical protein [Burkholderia gladioli]MBJ9714127.1 hypothetical protein [Burkholderia gladioli]MBU9157529.1 hypothetical protein [Burkholderia gladioli]MBU9218458.1 hypothetical protein [Burkholderia gladioli]MCH7272259.1 hypothetical protein [Burkholderia gladioli]MDN7725187.1 hypothetical protein [Burkholderia gladioli]